MSDAFDPPKGDAAGLASAAGKLGHVTTGLNSDAGQTKRAVATAVEQWRAPRGDSFREAGAGMQAQLFMVITAVERVTQAVDAYAKALTQTTQDVADYKRQAARAQSDAEARTRSMNPDDPEVDRMFQHAGMRQGQLAQQALGAKADLHTLAVKLASSIDMETDLAVPGSAKLSPDEIRRRVDSSLGVAGLQSAAANCTLTDSQAWDALAQAQKAVPKDAVNEDGSVDWKKAVAEFNDKYFGPPTSVGGVAVAPSEGWALYRLLLNQREVAATANDLRTAFDDIVGPVGLDLDRGLAGLNEINDALIRFKAVNDAFDVLSPSAETAEAVERAAAGGLPEAGVIGRLGKFAGGLAVVGDVLTLIDPGVENKTEGKVLQGAAALNIAGTGMAFSGTLGALVGINAVADWIPVAGQVVMVVTGLVLAGDYVYHHWDQISSGVSTAYHATTHALGTAASATGNALSSAGHAIGHAFSSIF